MGSAEIEPGPIPRMRIDKWLWAARFFKTRSLATAAVEASQVRLDGERVKPAHAVRVDDRISVRRDGLVWAVVVTGMAERRGSATEAAKLYRETAESAQARADEIAKRKAAMANAPRFDGRPTKRDRRRLQDFLDEP